MVIWGANYSGSYTSEFAYWWLVDDYPTDIANLRTWPWVWRARVPENVKHFGWLLAHENLPTYSFLVYRHISSDLFFTGVDCMERLTLMS